VDTKEKSEQGHGRRTEWQGSFIPLDFETVSKKGCFTISRGKKQISPLLAPSGKNFGKIPYWPHLEKILPTLMSKVCDDSSLNFDMSQ